MRLLYVDESESANRLTLAGLSISDSNWRQFFNRLVAFRKQTASKYGIRLRDEWHARDIWSNRGVVRERNLTFTFPMRRDFFREVVLFTRHSPEIEVFVASFPGPSKLEHVWGRLIQRFENDLLLCSERGIVIADTGHDFLYRRISRRMMVFNPIPSMVSPGQVLNKPILNIIEDPVFRDSTHSYFVQLADIISWICRVRHDPTANQRKWRINELYKALKPVLKLRASRHDPYGFVIK